MTMLKKLRRENKWGKNVPVILLTNVSANSDAVNAEILENQPSYYLVKADWSLSDVVEKVRERLSRSK